MNAEPSGDPAYAQRSPVPWTLAAVWAAVVFGVLEGAVLAIARLDPRILAPLKVSNDILWVAPLVNIPAFLLAGLLGWLAYRFGPRALRRIPVPRAAAALFVFGGAFSVLFSPRVIGPVGAALLALGLAVASTRFAAERGARMLAFMRRRIAWLPVSLALLAGVVMLAGRLRERMASNALAEAPRAVPDVLILLLDTVRRDRFSADRAPNLTRLAQAGITFDNAWSTTSWSLPSQASVLTGRYPFDHGADFPGIGLAADALTLGEYFQRRGYATGAFSSNSAWIVPEHLGRGFVRFDAYILEDLARRTVAGRVAERALNRFGYHKAGRGKDATVLTAQFLDFVDDYESRPYFAYLCFMDVNRNMHRRALGHAFWESRATKDEVLATYDSAITALDEEIGRMLGELERRGRLGNTLIVVTSDHGESFGEGILGDHDPEGHGTSLYPEQVRVPLFVVAPGAITPARHDDRVASIRAIPATIAALLGDDDRPFPGQPLVRPPDAAPVPELATLDYDAYRVRSVIWDRWQYLAYPAEPEREALFDLRQDPAARRNLALQARGAVAAARAALARLYPGADTLPAAGPASSGR